mgnify:CR=1 FL=1
MYPMQYCSIFDMAAGPMWYVVFVQYVWRAVYAAARKAEDDRFGERRSANYLGRT